MRARLAWLLLWAAGLPAASAAQPAREPRGLHESLERLEREGHFSGVVVIRGRDGVRFARGYGWADPFERRRFAPDTPVDSASLAKPITAAAVLALAADGRIELDSVVRRYLPEFPHTATTVRQLLAHSAGLAFDDSPEALAGKSNAELLAGAGAPLFAPGSAFEYCNMCSVALALLVERVSGAPYLDFARQRVAVPRGVALRPPRLADWRGRAIGHRRVPGGVFERFDSWEGERFYGPANLSLSATQLAQWGSEWWRAPLRALRASATAPALIGANRSGLTLGNWYCARGKARCHYLGHHEGFHHMLYWDSERRISIAMVSNNALAPALQQRLQRALVAFAEAEPARARRELAAPLADVPPPLGRFELGPRDMIEVAAAGERRAVRRRGVEYPAYPVGAGICYVPGLDAYISGLPGGRLGWLTLYEDVRVRPTIGR